MSSSSNGADGGGGGGGGWEEPSTSNNKPPVGDSTTSTSTTTFPNEKESTSDSGGVHLKLPLPPTSSTTSTPPATSETEAMMSSLLFATCSPHSTEVRSFNRSSSGDEESTNSASSPSSPPPASSEPHPPPVPPSSSLSADTFHTPATSLYEILENSLALVRQRAEEEESSSSPTTSSSLSPQHAQDNLSSLSSPVREIFGSSSPEEGEEPYEPSCNRAGHEIISNKNSINSKDSNSANCSRSNSLEVEFLISHQEALGEEDEEIYSQGKERQDEDEGEIISPDEKQLESNSNSKDGDGRGGEQLATNVLQTSSSSSSSSGGGDQNNLLNRSTDSSNSNSSSSFKMAPESTTTIPIPQQVEKLQSESHNKKGSVVGTSSSGSGSGGGGGGGKKRNWYSHIFSASYKSRSGDFKKLFKELPGRERLLVDYSCALQREILVQGRMYVSQGHVAFHANIFGWETQTVIRLKDIASITKEKTALVIPNAIQVGVKGGDKYFFTSFVTRDATFMMLFKLWQSALLEDSMPSTEIQRLILSAYGEDLIISSEEEEVDFEHNEGEGTTAIDEMATSGEKTSKAKITRGKESGGNKKVPSSSSSPLNRSSAAAAAVGQVCATELGPALAVSGALGSSILTSNSTSNNAKAKNKTLSSSTSSLPPLVIQNESSPAPSPKLHHPQIISHHLPLSESSSSSSSSSESSEGEEDDDEVAAEDEFTAGIPPVPCPSASHTEGRETLNATFPIHIDALFTMLFTNSKFYLDLHTSRNTVNVKQSAWDEEPETAVKRRVVSMTVSLSNVMGPKHSHVTETQIMLPSSRPGAFYGIDSESVNAGIPYADTFAVTIHYCLSRVSSCETRLRVVNNIKYKKSVWGITKSIIEKNCWAGVEEFYSHLGRALGEETAKMSLGASPVPSPKKIQVKESPAGQSGSLPRRLRPQRKVKGKAPDVPTGVPPLGMIPKAVAAAASSTGRSSSRNGIVESIGGGVVRGGAIVPEVGEGGVGVGGSSGAAVKVILGVLVGLLLLNGFLFFKLTRLENAGPSFISPQTFTFTGELPQSHGDWLSLLERQEALHRVELQKWHDILISALSVLRNAEVDLQTLKTHISSYGDDFYIESKSGDSKSDDSNVPKFSSSEEPKEVNDEGADKVEL